MDPLGVVLRLKKDKLRLVFCQEGVNIRRGVLFIPNKCYR